MTPNPVLKKNPLFTALKRGRKALEPRRNYHCPQYEECLDEAANLDCDLSCRRCPWDRILDPEGSKPDS